MFLNYFESNFLVIKIQFTSRKRKKLLSPGNWFKTRRKEESQKQRRNRKKKAESEEPEIITVLFVPQTPGDETTES